MNSKLKIALFKFKITVTREYTLINIISQPRLNVISNTKTEIVKLTRLLLTNSTDDFDIANLCINQYLQIKKGFYIFLGLTFLFRLFSTGKSL